MKFSLQSVLPESYKRLKPREKVVAVTLGAGAVIAVGYFLHRKSTSMPRSPGSISVQGVWTDLANKLNIAIGADLEVRTAQQYLNKVSSAGLAVDGVLGSATQAALRKFQAGNGLPQTGAIDEETGNALQYMAAAVSKTNPQLQKLVTVKPGILDGGVWHDLVLKLPKLGPPFTDTLQMSVKGAQRALNDLTHANLPLNGVLDARTIAALKWFQTRQALPATGQLDSETSNALLYLASAANPSFGVTYKPQAMPQVQPPSGAPPALSAAMQAQLAQGGMGAGPVDIGSGWVMYGNCACKKDDAACIASCTAQATAGHFTGSQSTTMYDPRFHYGF